MAINDIQWSTDGNQPPERILTDGALLLYVDRDGRIRSKGNIDPKVLLTQDVVNMLMGQMIRKFAGGK